MRHILHCHPDTPCTAVAALEAEVSRGPGGALLVHYYLLGEVGAVVPSLRMLSTNRRADELWLHTCFEAFVKPEGSEAYWEFNIAPTWDWQCYALSGYRTGRHPEDAIAAPSAEGRYAENGWELRTHWSLAGVVPDDKPWQLGLSAVIEDKSGAISYWALRHAPDQPDFHHASAFALTVTP